MFSFMGRRSILTCVMEQVRASFTIVWFVGCYSQICKGYEIVLVVVMAETIVLDHRKICTKHEIV